MDKKQVVIVIPVYKKKLSLTEQASLLQVQKIWGKYPRVFMAPEGLDFDYGPMMDGFTVERFPSMYFKGVTGYSILLLTPAFYERFQEYEYMQIYQLDAFVFYDALPKYCAAGYDYIGAPVRWYGPHWHAIGTEVGNGGFSLRRVSSCLRMVRQLEEQEGKVPLYTAFSACEDMFFGYCGTRPELDFHVPDTSYAVRYAVQDNVRHAYQRLAKGEIPMGCHGWSKSYYPVWEELIRQAGYNLGGPYPRQLTYQDVYLKKYRTYHRKMAVGRLYGLIHRKEWQPALNLLTQWLQKWPAGDEVWAAQGEEWVFLSFISMMPDEPDSMMAGLLTQALLEALRRSLLVGEEWQENLNRAKTVLYTMEQQHISLPLDTHVLEQAVQQAAWKAWQEKAPERPVWAHREDGIRIVAVTAVHNEADVVESFVRHTLRFADALIVCDCNSTDQTAHILAELQQEGLPLTVHAAYGDGQDTLLPAMLQEAVQEQGADYVLPLEADAFLLPQQGTCRAVIGQRSPDTIYAIPQRRYVSAEAYADQASFLLDRPLYRSKSCSDVQGYLIGAKAAGHLQLQMKQGNLTAVPIDAQGEKQMRALEEIPSLSIARFPWRSPEQYRARVAMRWPEIAMRYSVDTAEGGRYRADYMRLLEGQDVPWQELLPDFEPADLRAFVPSQKLQYSEGVKPDAWRTLLAASEHLAEKAAIERTIAKHICATTVAPFLGDEAAFLTSLRSALQQTWPHHQILLPILQGEPSAELQKAVPCSPQRIWLSAADGDIFAQLAKRAEGEYVQWLLPGETIQPVKLSHMMASMESQPENVSMLLSDGAAADFQDAAPYRGVQVSAELNRIDIPGPDLWQLLLKEGKYPSSGLSGLLMRRTILDHRDWLRGGFTDGRPSLMRIWQLLLRAMPEREKHQNLGVLYTGYAGHFVELPLEKWAEHQMDWWNILQEERPHLSEGEYAQACTRMQQNGITILTEAVQQNIDTSTSIWTQYQRMLLQL